MNLLVIFLTVIVEAAIVEQLMAAQRASLAELDVCFATLQQRAFKG